jgi:hypothetical protein
MQIKNKLVVNLFARTVTGWTRSDLAAYAYNWIFSVWYYPTALTVATDRSL